jgi:hypothetical protein
MPNADEYIYEPNLGLDISSLPSKLIAPPVPELPIGMFYPLAPMDGYSLQHDQRYMIGYVYGTSYLLQKMQMHKKRMLNLLTPPNVNPMVVDGCYVSEPILGMVELIPGIPFVIHIDGKKERTHTVACAQTLESLKIYPDYTDIETTSVQLAKITWGCSKNGIQPEIKPIYEIIGLKQNDRASARSGFNNDHFDGSFSLGPTVMKGNGPGIFLPAVQASTPEATSQIETLLRILHCLYRMIMPKCLSAFEWDMINFHKLFNNVMGFGGLEPNGTGMQMNSSSLGTNLQKAIGMIQGQWHVDENDDHADWTLFTLLLRVGPSK